MPRKSAAERQKQYREKLKNENPEKYAEIKQKTAARALEYYRKKQRNLTEEQKEEIRLRRNALEQNEKKTHTKTYNKNYSENQPKENFLELTNIENRRDIKNLQSRIEYKRRQETEQLQDNMQKLWRGFKSLQKRCSRQQKKLDELNKTCENLKSELHSLKERNVETIDVNEYTPLKKTEHFVNNNLKDISTPQREAVKRTLLEHNVLKESLKEKFASSPNITKNTLKQIVNNDLVKKYKLKTSLTKSLGLRSNFKKYRNTKHKRNEMMNTIKEFYTRDDVSRASAGKKECITRKKIKMQKRYLLANLKTLHKKFVNEIGKISFSSFKKYRPFYIVSPTVKDLETCGCIKHSNMKFRATKLKSLGLIETDDLNDIISTTVCDIHFKTCMYGDCNSCAEKCIQGNDTLTEKVTWHEWKNIDHEYGEPGNIKKTKKMTKIDIEGNAQDLTDTFNRDLPSFKRHVYNVYHQYRQYKYCLENLKDNEVLIHIDFSENWTAKYFEEVQAMHFGASKTQITLHTGVYYTKDVEPVSFCSVSPDNQHNPEAIWAHLDPVLKNIKSSHSNIDLIHFYSDGPTTQYRQKKNFYLFSKKLYDYGFVHGTWNFFEASHGKGAADGIGGAVKRSLDSTVAHGHDIPNAEKAFDVLTSSETSINMFYVPSDKIQNLEADAGTILTPLKNTMKVHQLITEKKFTLKHRELSCFCKNFDGRCDCHFPNIHSFKQDSENINENDKTYILDDATGDFREANMPEVSKHINNDNFDSIFTEIDLEANMLEHMTEDKLDLRLFTEIDFLPSSTTDTLAAEFNDGIDAKESCESPSLPVTAAVEKYNKTETVYCNSPKVLNPTSENEIILNDSFPPLPREPCLNDYVIIRFISKKDYVYYVGKILEILDEDEECDFFISYLKLKSKAKQTFTEPLDPDTAGVQKLDIKYILPAPKFEGTNRRISTILFPVDMSLLKLRY